MSSTRVTRPTFFSDPARGLDVPQDAARHLTSEQALEVADGFTGEDTFIGVIFSDEKCVQFVWGENVLVDVPDVARSGSLQAEVPPSRAREILAWLYQADATPEAIGGLTFEPW